MKSANRLFWGAPLILASLYLAACSGVPQSSSGGTGGTGSGGTVTIGGTVTGLSGTGLVLQNKGGDNLSVTASGTFTFKTGVATGSAYAVTVLTQPTGPAQNCVVTSGSGTASANVTSVAVACTNAATNAKIGGTVSGLVTNTSVVLQDNGGDSLTITSNGAFTFKTAVTNGTYAVTVLTQPVSPNQICTVTNGSGTATSDVTNVAVNCVLAFSIGGTVNGLVGSGMVLQDNGSDNLTITSSNASAFTFTKLVPTGGNYAVTIGTQPSSPTQTCVIAAGTGSGVATANATSVIINCPAVTFSVGGSVVGLQGKTPTPPTQINLPLTDNTFQLQNNLGNTLVISQNGPFTFATPEALNDQYEVSVFHGASTQTTGCTLWNYKGVVTANVTNILIDCAHNDWTWIDGKKVAGVPSTPQFGQFPTTAPTSSPNPLTNTPGARYGAAGWTDSFGSLFLFGGAGFELSGKNPPDTLPSAMSDIWVCDMSFGVDFCQWQLVGGHDSTAVGSSTVGAGIIANAQNGFGTGVSPAPRLGAASWTDASGNFWLFGGSDGNNFRNDLWKYDHSSLNPSTYQTAEGIWSNVAGPLTVDQPGNYTTGTLVPGARTNAVTWTDGSGNLWLFGGFGYDGTGAIGFLNDLWKFNGTTWTFVSGGTTNQVNQNGIYGTQGTAAATNMPGGRQEAAGWVDASGNLWLFGGEGEDATGTPNGILNDLWVYNVAGNQWTWVAGSNAANRTGTYPAQPVTGPVSTTTAAGTCGLAVGDPAHSCPAISTTGAFPGSRWGASAWTDANGNLWLFGGWGLDSTGTNGNGALNDLWVYTPNATAGQPGTWAWIKGSNTGAQNGNYGDMLIPYRTFQSWTPGGRSNSTHWVDNRHQLWLFGGLGYDSTSTTGNGYLNDLWRYLPYP